MAQADRLPDVARTSKGVGDGATVGLNITLYRSPDGVTPDFGFIGGRDAQGSWELPYANPAECDAIFGQIMAKLIEKATEAREDDGDSGATPTVWLKAVGAQGFPVEEVWYDPTDPNQGVDYPYKPRSVKVGDILVVYYATTGKIVGVLEVTSPWFPGGKTTRWSYRTKTKAHATVPVSQGFALDSLSVERKIGKSIRQKSHIRLRDGEAKIALDLFGVPAP